MHISVPLEGTVVANEEEMTYTTFPTLRVKVPKCCTRLAIKLLSVPNLQHKRISTIPIPESWKVMAENFLTNEMKIMTRNSL
jgi:hypothetical protein